MGKVREILMKGQAAAEKALAPGGDRARLPVLVLPDSDAMDDVRSQTDDRVDDLKKSIQDLFKMTDEFKAVINKNVKNASGSDFGLDPKRADDQKIIKAASKSLTDSYAEALTVTEKAREQWSKILSSLPRN